MLRPAGLAYPAAVPDRHEFCPAAHRSNLRCRSISPRSAPRSPPKSAGVDLCLPARRRDRRRDLVGHRPLRRGGLPRPAPDRRAAARLRRPLRPAGDRPRRRAGRTSAGWRSRRSATSPTWTRTTTSAAWTTGAGSTASATGCGTPTPPTCRCRSVLGMLHAVALPPPSPFGNGETEFADMRAAYDALPDATKAGDRRTGGGARHVLVARPDRLHRVPAGRARAVPAVAAAPGAHCIPARSARRCICRRTPRTSSAGRWRTAGCCCGTSPRTRRSGSSSTATPGGSAIW